MTDNSIKDGNSAVPKPSNDSKTGPERQQPPEAADRKKETSRIPLDGWSVPASKKATSRIPDVPVPETIRLKRPPGPAPQSQPPSSEAPTIGKPQSAKKQTSRIIIPGLPDDQQKRAGGGETEPVPETIRLKRPDDTSAIEPGDQSKFDAARKSETARIDIMSDNAAPAPLTQRKTIKIKRSERKVVPRTVSIARSGEKGEVDKEAVRDAPEAAEEVGAFFSLAAVASVLFAGFLVYLLAAQLLPDLALPTPSIPVLQRFL